MRKKKKKKSEGAQTRIQYSWRISPLPWLFNHTSKTLFSSVSWKTLVFFAEIDCKYEKHGNRWSCSELIAGAVFLTNTLSRILLSVCHYQTARSFSTRQVVETHPDAVLGVWTRLPSKITLTSYVPRQCKYVCFFFFQWKTDFLLKIKIKYANNRSNNSNNKNKQQKDYVLMFCESCK